MDPERWRQIEQLYHAALERAPELRASFLDGACHKDASLREGVEALLAQGQQAPADVTATLPVGEAGVNAQLGSYQVVSRLGAGGMGEVYRAHDTKLGRDVAIKTLPPEFARDPERLARFRREARLLASLNHPNIATIHGLEESGGTTYLVLELVEGKTVRGPLPVDKALDCARQIAEALEAAHNKGVVHRDLKPSNVMVTPENRVKVLDFGLAKALRGAEPGRDLSQMATITELETVVGLIMGTPPYMSPEQVRGEELDKRTDIWSFGCLLYEMLTGKRAFRGETQSENLAAILEREPDWQALPATTPARIKELLRRCLQKDVARRLPDMGEARVEIEKACPHRGTKRWQLAAVVFAVIAILAFGAAWWGAGLLVWLAAPDPLH